MDHASPKPANDAVNGAVFADFSDQSFLVDAIAGAVGDRPLLVVTSNGAFGSLFSSYALVEIHELGLDQAPLSYDAVSKRLKRRLHIAPHGAAVVVDMTWSTAALHSSVGLEAWGAFADRIALETGTPILSLYNRELLTEEPLHAALRAHRQFAAPSGLYENPFWLPPDLRRATPDARVSFLLGRVVPDYADTRFFERSDPFAARGADPDWLENPRHHPTDTADTAPWSIYCLGQLRVFRDGNQLVNWKLPGSAAKKNQTLFAYLLSNGEKGAEADRIAELLWPEGGSENTKRARLHHSIAMLRKTLGSNESVLRSGDHYRLNPPAGSWIDITAFEQLCRRGMTLFSRGQDEEAMQLYLTAEKLYGGDLFEGVPLKYVDNELEDWCMPRRIWLREMAVKLHRDYSIQMRRRGQLREALEHCQKALKLDPASEEANAETLRVFHAQGRTDALTRQFRQYTAALQAIGATIEGSEVNDIFLSLTTP